MNGRSVGLLRVESASEVDSGAAAPRLRVLVVHDHDVIRSGFRLLLGRLDWVDRCLGASDVDRALEMWQRYEPHVALVDLYVGGTPGTELCRAMRAARTSGHVVLMSSTGQVSSKVASAVGALGFVPTSLPADRIAHVVREAGMGHAIFQRQQECDVPLTEREREVLALIAQGSTNREIAQELYLSPHTVKGHTRELYRKLTARNRAEAVQRAQRVGLLV
jgi:DNA-binding NarL/FixJ family response regulator